MRVIRLSDLGVDYGNSVGVFGPGFIMDDGDIEGVILSRTPLEEEDEEEMALPVAPKSRRLLLGAQVV